MGRERWTQFIHAEIMSMHGVETAAHQSDDHDDCCDDRIPEGEPEGCCSSGCMDCLGLSWRDFM